MIAQNLGFQALIAGHSVRFTKASELLDELSAADGAFARRRCLRKYSLIDLLIVDEVGYLSYDNRYADLLYEVITARYQNRSTIVTTNRPFQEWGAVFPNAACNAVRILMRSRWSRPRFDKSPLFVLTPHNCRCF
jgi:DNA replication protein DnaC